MDRTRKIFRIRSFSRVPFQLMRLISINKLQEKIPLPKWVFKPTTYRMKVEEGAIFSVKRSQNFIIHQIKEVDLAQSSEFKLTKNPFRATFRI